MSKRSLLHSLYYDIAADIEHGECFYDKEMFDSFIRSLDRMKKVAIEYFNDNQIIDEEE
jgi:hypothetical protein